MVLSAISLSIHFWGGSSLKNAYKAFRTFWKHSLQSTGFFRVGLNGTVVSLRKAEFPFGFAPLLHAPFQSGDRGARNCMVAYPGLALCVLDLF